MNLESVRKLRLAAVIAGVVWAILTYLYFIGPETPLERYMRTAAFAVAVFAAVGVYLFHPWNRQPPD